MLCHTHTHTTHTHTHTHNTHTHTHSHNTHTPTHTHIHTHTHTHTHTHIQHTHTHTHTGQSGSKLFLAQVLSRAHSAANICSPKEQQEVWHSCIIDLQRVKTLDKEVTSSASCAAIFIQCQLLINKVTILE